MQQAWIDHDVAQCGYCQPGQIMTAVALVNQVQAEGREVNDADLDAIRNVCRCGTYFRIRAAINSATPTPGCPLVSGKLNGERLGNITLGMTRAEARHAYGTSKKTTRGHIDTFCLTPSGIHVGYPTPALLDTLPEHQRAHYQNRVIWASTSSTFYNLHHIRPGTTVQDAHHHAKLTGPVDNHYYLTTHGPATGILKTNKNVVQEIGIAAKALTKTHHQRLELLKTFR